MKMFPAYQKAANISLRLGEPVYIVQLDRKRVPFEAAEFDAFTRQDFDKMHPQPHVFDLLINADFRQVIP